MGFQNDLQSISGLAQAYAPGLQALQAQHHALIRANNPRQLSGSADLDSALQSHYPNSSRWDYVVARRASAAQEKLYWIEVHPANSTGEIDAVIAKRAWLKDWLRTHGTALEHYDREFIWVPTGKVAFTANAPGAKRLAKAGIIFRPATFAIP